jgi:ABC-type Fe3+-siderophore transport system permease subunit
MKKTIMLLLLLLFAGTVFAGNIGTIIATDTLIGFAGGAAMGAALSTPAFLNGNGTNGRLYLIGAGWGGLIGAGIGLLYSIYNIAVYTGSTGATPQRKAFLGIDGLNLCAAGTGITIVQKF